MSEIARFPVEAGSVTVKTVPNTPHFKVSVLAGADGQTIITANAFAEAVGASPNYSEMQLGSIRVHLVISEEARIAHIVTATPPASVPG